MKIKAIKKTIAIPVAELTRMISEYLGEEMEGYDIEYIDRNYPFNESEYNVTFVDKAYTAKVMEYQRNHSSPLQACVSAA